MNTFDIVIPTYNRFDFIERTINSVKQQNYNNWNLYILDNASTDNTKDLVETFLCEKIHYVVNETNIGMLRNWKKAISEIGNAKYIVLISDDDELQDDFLEKANEAINEYPDLGLYSSSVYVKNEDSKSAWMSEYIVKKNKIFQVCPPSQNLHYFLAGNPISPAAIMLKKSCVKSIIDFHLSYSKFWAFDRYWWAQIALTNTTVFCCIPTAIYHQHNQSESSNLSKNNFDLLMESFRVTAKISNTAFNLELVTINQFKLEIIKLNPEHQLDVLCSLILFGHKNLNDFALQYFNENNELVLSKIASFKTKMAYQFLGIKVMSYIRMFKSRT
jgi:glycosyltransferase involved in cell wall biosynthesis